jgi:catecholate siderophore receptor
VPGITINAGEGGAHGDSVNLRGISVPDSFFLDGLRDIGLYQRDTFDEEAVEVLLGPSSVLFGRGSTAGVINQVTKQAIALADGGRQAWRLAPRTRSARRPTSTGR